MIRWSKLLEMKKKLVRNSPIRLPMSGSSREASLWQNRSRRIILPLSRRRTRGPFFSRDRNSTCHWCSYSWWNSCCADATAKNSTHVWWIPKYRVRPLHPQTPGNGEKGWLNMGCLSGWFTEEIIARKERLWTKAQYTTMQEFLLTGKAFYEWFNHKYLSSFYLRWFHWRFPRVRASTFPMTRVSYRVLKERRWAYLRLLALPTDELWITYGSGKNVQNIPALAIAMSSGPDKASTLQCSMHQLGVILLLLLEGVERKRLGICGTCFLNWYQCEKSSKHHHKRLQRNAWLCLRGLLSLYMTVKQPYESKRGATKALFKEARSLDSIPPTGAWLEQHVKKAVFQGGYLWGQTLLCQPVLSSPSDSGWRQFNNSWSPFWIALPQAKESCHELIRCGCRSSCRGPCKCLKANSACTGLCNCGGNF